MKIHRHLLAAVVTALSDIFQKGYYADKVIERHLKLNRKWGARDRRFFAEMVYDLVRWWRRLWYALNREPSFENSDLWHLVGAWLRITQDQTPDWPEWRNLDFAQIQLLYAHPQNTAVVESVPDWLFALGQSELKDNWPQILRELNQTAPVFLRVNNLRASLEQLRAQLLNEGVSAQTTSSGGALVLEERKNVFITEAFRQGLFEVQDIHSQLIAPFLQPQPGDRIIDACAGAGGKTLHLAALMRNRGRIIAMDVGEKKLLELQKRARRARVDIIETRVIASSKVIKRLHDSADRVLLDVPCSGLGVLRRNPDSKWKLTLEEVLRLKGLQAEILSNYSLMVKRGGKLVYSTCSVLPSENQNQIAGFLQSRPDWQMEEEKSVWPRQGGGDGFYMVRLVRVK